MDDIEIESDSDSDGVAEAVRPRRRSERLAAAAFTVAGVLLVLAPFCQLYSNSAQGHFAIDGWGGSPSMTLLRRQSRDSAGCTASTPGS